MACAALSPEDLQAISGVISLQVAPLRADLESTVGKIHELDEKFDAQIAELRLEQQKLRVSVEEPRLLCWNTSTAKPLDEDNLFPRIAAHPSQMVTAAQSDAKLITMGSTLMKAIASTAGHAPTGPSTLLNLRHPLVLHLSLIVTLRIETVAKS
ncbi:unnamed protein product, partial [Prorocentrum cordatum]